MPVVKRLLGSRDFFEIEMLELKGKNSLEYELYPFQNTCQLTLVAIISPLEKRYFLVQSVFGCDEDQFPQGLISRFELSTLAL